MKFRITQRGEEGLFFLYTGENGKWGFQWSFASIESARAAARRIAGLETEKVVEEFEIKKENEK